MKVKTDLNEEIALSYGELRGRVYRGCIGEIVEMWDSYGEGEYKDFLRYMYEIKWKEYVEMN